MNSPRLQALCSEIKSAFSELVQPGCRVLLAVSGGSDSLALLHWSARLAPELQLELVVGFVDHGLREGVNAERRLVEEQAGRLGIEFHGLRAAAEQAQQGVVGGSLQQWARNERYRLLEELAGRVGASHIATGHTLDDQAETFLLRLLRGTGLDGLRSIPRTRPLGKTRLIRPLLGVSRSDLRAVLEEEKIPWAEDPSNVDRRYHRVRVRRELLPLMEDLQPGVTGRLGELAREIEGATRVLDTSTDVNRLGVQLQLSPGIKVPAARFDALPGELWPRLVRGALAEVRGDLRRIERVHVDALVAQVARREVTAGTQLPGTAVVYASRGDLFVFREEPQLGGLGECRVTPAADGGLRVEWGKLDVRATVHATGPVELSRLAFRVWQPGDRLYDSRSSLKKSFQKAGVPLVYRGIYPVVVCEDRVVAALEVVPSRLGDLHIEWALGENSPLRDLL